ncbi:MAG: hypothetical protein N2662_10455 [Bacteroidales bacterium]|nr:hypothetical protein [Bacteroidales bacterium]
MMFSFGIFATHTPYVVLAALYMCFLGSWVISSLFPQVTHEININQQLHGVTIELSHPYHQVSDFSKKNIYKYNSQIQKSNHPFEPEKKSVLFKIWIFDRIFTIPFCIVSLEKIWRLYNRPPPSFL